jgi:DNA-binding FadR family transcriptional regulator
MITLDRDNYLQILEFRLITEVESARLCAERCKEKTLSEIEKCYDIMVNHQDDHEPFAKADMEFHMKIAEGTQNPLIIKVNSVLQNLLIYHQKVLNSILGPMGGLTEHKQILEAIKKRDPELSALFMRRHIERTIRELKEKDL